MFTKDDILDEIYNVLDNIIYVVEQDNTDEDDFEFYSDIYYQLGEFYAELGGLIKQLSRYKKKVK